MSCTGINAFSEVFCCRLYSYNIRWISTVDPETAVGIILRYTRRNIPMGTVVRPYRFYVHIGHNNIIASAHFFFIFIITPLQYACIVPSSVWSRILLPMWFRVTHIILQCPCNPSFVCAYNDIKYLRVSLDCEIVGEDRMCTDP